MTRRVMCWLGLSAVSVLLVGCGGGFEAGVPKDAGGMDFSKVPDPMGTPTTPASGKAGPQRDPMMNP